VWCLGGVSERDHFYDYQIVYAIQLHIGLQALHYHTGTIVVVVFLFAFFSL